MNWSALSRACAAVGLMVGVAALGAAVTAPVVPRTALLVAGGPSATAGPDRAAGKRSADSVMAALVEIAPFRMNRRAASVRFDPQSTGVQTAQLRPAVPSLHLAGIVWSDRPVAVVGGIPGTAGARAMQVGDTIGGIQLRRVTKGGAMLAGFDTAWSLTLETTRQ